MDTTRVAAAGTLTLISGAFVLLLAASIFYSCRSGANPHNTGTSGSLSVPEPSSAVERAHLSVEHSDSGEADDFRARRPLAA